MIVNYELYEKKMGDFTIKAPKKPGGITMYGKITMNKVIICGDCMRDNFEFEHQNKFVLSYCEVCEREIILLNDEFNISLDNFNSFVHKNINYNENELLNLFKLIILNKNNTYKPNTLAYHAMVLLNKFKTKHNYLLSDIFKSELLIFNIIKKSKNKNDNLIQHIVNDIVYNKKLECKDFKRLTKEENKILWELAFRFNRLDICGKLNPINNNVLSFIISEFDLYNKYVNVAVVANTVTIGPLIVANNVVIGDNFREGFVNLNRPHRY